MRIRLAAICLSLLVSSVASADLRIFEVDAQHQQEVFEAIRNVLNRGIVGDFNSNGAADQLPNGQILVNAQAPVLAQLELVIKAINERPVAPAPRVTLRYWAVLGTQAPATATNAIGTAPPPGLNDVLGELRRLNGNLTFRVIGTAAVTSDSGQKGAVTADTMSVEQLAHAQGDTLNAYMQIHAQGTRENQAPGPPRFSFGEIELRTSLRRGEFVVLGESQFDGAGTEIDGVVYYIVHWANDK
jgi:hypothetical protein